MLSVFERFLKKELGKHKYESYCSFFEQYKISKSIQNRMESSQEVYEDLYNALKDQDVTILQLKMERLIDSMCEAVNISKHYMFTFFFYLGGALFLIMKNLDPKITTVSLILLSAIFIYKTCEFVTNKYCYIDANIVLVYKSVLDQLINKRKKNHNLVQ